MLSIAAFICLLLTTIVAVDDVDIVIESDTLERRDANRDGSLSFDELRTFLQALDDEEQSAHELRLLFDQFDANRDGVWSREEYAAFKKTLRATLFGASHLSAVVVALAVGLVTVLGVAGYRIRNLQAQAASAAASAAAALASAPSKIVAGTDPVT